MGNIYGKIYAVVARIPRGRAEPGFEEEQRGRLEREGVRFSADGRIALRHVQWKR